MMIANIWTGVDGDIYGEFGDDGDEGVNVVIYWLI